MTQTEKKAARSPYIMPSALAPLDSPKMPETRIIPQKAKSTLSTLPFVSCSPKLKGEKKSTKIGAI